MFKNQSGKRQPRSWPELHFENPPLLLFIKVHETKERAEKIHKA